MRVDIAKLRKIAGMSQRELAGLLNVRPSFLSAIENGRSRLPDEKLHRIREIFGLSDSTKLPMIDDTAETPGAAVPPHTHVMEQGDSLTHLLTHFHDMAHQNSRASAAAEDETTVRIEYLEKRNDRLSERVDNLRDEVDALRDENLRLKQLLVKAGIDF